MLGYNSHRGKSAGDNGVGAVQASSEQFSPSDWQTGRFLDLHRGWAGAGEYVVWLWLASSGWLGVRNSMAWMWSRLAILPYLCAQSGCGGDLCGASSSLYHHPDHHLCGVDMQGRSHTKGRAGAAASTTTAKDVLVLPQTVIMHRGEKWTLACLKSRQSFSLSYI
ncbi:hypothetical protein Fcan01_12386 [Folsomia candida]|uniref:Uncharacterized protein n=1 Tax=Folsomia candida TaxID=158441 RepID=A0A226E5Y6_FOLCA|nr:hypothetical protein Fcan01_12386 [Folsomia candida]